MTIEHISKKLGHGVERRENLGIISVPSEHFTSVCNQLFGEMSLPLSLLYATDERKEKAKGFGIHALASLDEAHEWILISTTVPADAPIYESLTKTIMAAHWYERYAMDMFGVIAEGHPDPRRLVHHENIPLHTHPLRKDFDVATVLEHANVSYPMHHVSGEGIYEIPVGPIHAGVIEPGHFKFNVAGERIITLEGKLFFTHKGVEKLVEGKTALEALPFIERVSGDMSASHSLAFCQAVEQVGGTKIPQRAQRIRTLICELERIGMHIHDMANMTGMGTGYTVMAAQGFRLKEEMVQLSTRLVGNRFWRGMIVPGGVAKDVTDELTQDIEKTLTHVYKKLLEMIELGKRSDGLRDRLETTGILSHEAALAYGALGVAARASGISRDVRRDHPYASYEECVPQIITLTEGDVYARYRVRYKEIAESVQLVGALLKLLQEHSGKIQVPCEPTNGMALGVVESWRGEIITVVYFKDSVLERCVIRDPSFCNWALFGELAPGNIVPDFPLCNKSLDLSYSGNDL